MKKNELINISPPAQPQLPEPSTSQDPNPTTSTTIGFSPLPDPPTPQLVQPKPIDQFQSYSGAEVPPVETVTPSNVTLTGDQMIKAQKYCKWAGSALSYDDVKSGIENLQKALRLLQTGQDSA